MDFLHHGAADAVLRGVPASACVLHWHGDMFEIPSGARRLASTKVCPNQGFQLGKKQFGLQFHCEVDALEGESRRRLPDFTVLGDRLLDNILNLMDG